MLVHSFSKRASGFDDFCAFVKAMGIKAGVQPNVLIGPVQCDNISLYMGWVTDAAPIAESPSQYVERLRRYVQKLSAWCDRVRAVCDNRFQA